MSAERGGFLLVLALLSSSAMNLFEFISKSLGSDEDCHRAKARYGGRMDHFGAWVCFWLVGLVGFFAVRHLDARDAKPRVEKRRVATRRVEEK